MKRIALSIALLLPLLLWGQVSDENWNLMLIREDKVYPSKTNEYEVALTDLKEYLTSKKETGINYFTHLQDDYFFSHVTPISKLEDLGSGVEPFLAQKFQDPELDLIFKNLNEAIAYHRHYIVKYRPEHSYIPEGDNWSDGSPYRKWTYYQFKPGSEGEVEKVIASWKQLYASKGLENGFRVFSGYLGISQPTYIFTTWGANPLDYQADIQKNIESLGEEGIALWAKMMEYVQGAQSVEGWFLPQYSFAPGKKMAE